MIKAEVKTIEMFALSKVGRGADSLKLTSLPRPVASQGQALVRVLAAGVCGTDIHVANDEYSFEPPVVMGHEILGEVVSVGSAIDAVWVGSTVVCETYFSTCEICDWCRAGRRNLCPHRRSLGSFENGGFASFVVMPVANLHRLPTSLRGIEGVLAEPLACVTQCLLDPPFICAGDNVLVIGPGTVGQLAAQVAKSQGGTVTLAGLSRDAARLLIAAELGLDTTTSLPDVESYEVVIECSGSEAGASAGLRSAKRGGHYAQMGIFGKAVTLPVDDILYKELVVTSGFGSTATSWTRAISLIENGLVTLHPLITKRVSIHEWESAFAATAAGDGIKTVIIPDS